MKKLLKASILASALLVGANAQVINLQEGWNNVGIVDEASINDFNSEDIRIIWQYRDGKWDLYTPNQSWLESLRDDINSGNLDYGIIENSVEPGSALWIQANNDTQIRVGEENTFTSVTGVVKDSTTSDLVPVFNVSVDGEEPMTIDNNGTLDISQISLGNHTLIISAEGYKDLNMSLDLESATPQNLGQIYLIPDSALNNIELTGKVVDATTAYPIENAQIKLFSGYNNTDGEPVVSGVLENGEFDFNIPAGAYTVLIEADNYYSLINNYTFVGNEDNNISQDFALAPKVNEDSNDSVVLRTVLTWGGNEPDLDSHLVAYNESNQNVDWNIYYGDKTAYDYQSENDELLAQLDVDDTDYYGPETVTLKYLTEGETYKYFVYNYTNNNPLKDSNAYVSVIFNGREYSFQVPNEDGRVWKVFEINNGVLVPCVENCVTDNNYAQDVTYDEISNLKTLNNSDKKVLNDITNAYMTHPKK